MPGCWVAARGLLYHDDGESLDPVAPDGPVYQGSIVTVPSTTVLLEVTACPSGGDRSGPTVSLSSRLLTCCYPPRSEPMPWVAVIQWGGMHGSGTLAALEVAERQVPVEQAEQNEAEGLLRLPGLELDLRSPLSVVLTFAPRPSAA